MNKRRFLMGFLLFCAVWGELAAQTAPAGVSSFSPMVSGLTAEIRNKLVRLNWTDSAGAQGPVYIFRSARPFIGTVPPDSIPAAIPYGTQFYIDEIDGAGTFYYFVAASDLQGQRHDMPIPDANTIAVNASGAARSGAAEPLPGVSGISARAEGEAVIVSYVSGSEAETGEGNMILYRSLHPIRQLKDLLNAVIVQTGVNSPCVDYPIPGLSWYYAVVSEDEIIEGNAGIYPGRNATKEAVSNAGGEAPARPATRETRSMPLPAISLYNAAPGSDYLSHIPETVPLNEEAARALASVQTAPAAPWPEKKPRVFARDLEEPSGGENSELMRIVQDSFIKRDWRSAHDELQRYLSLPRSAAAEARARFYLGQTSYFSGKYREALFEFLSAQSLHPTETHVWIEATLAALVR
jgi:hypothetical protein